MLEVMTIEIIRCGATERWMVSASRKQVKTHVDRIYLFPLAALPGKGQRLIS